MKICLVSSGLEERNRRLQPWNYLFQIADTLIGDGHAICLISDRGRSTPPNDTVGGLPVIRSEAAWAPSWYRNRATIQSVTKQRPDALLWHLGLTGFVQPYSLRHLNCRLIGVFTSPVYQSRELLRLGILRLLRGYRMSAAHLLGLLVPWRCIRRAMDGGGFQQLVAECETTRRRLVERGFPANCIDVLRPSIDPIWLRAAPSPAERARKREELGLPRDAFVVGYFGPLAALRGLPALLRALSLLQDAEPSVRALILSRHRDGEPAEDLVVRRRVRQLGVAHRTSIVSGFLPPDELRRAVAACDAITLPFELVPSDVPLSVLEAMALGLPLITTDVACLPELVPDGTGLRVPPARPDLLSEAIKTLAQDVALRKQLGAAARRRVMSWQKHRGDGPAWTRLLERQVRPTDGTDVRLPGRS